MVDKVPTQTRTVIDLASYRERIGARAAAISVRTCRHCGAVLAEGNIDAVSADPKVVEVYLGR